MISIVRSFASLPLTHISKAAPNVIPTTNVWTKLTGWTLTVGDADRYTSDGIIIPTGMNIELAGAITFTETSSFTRSIRLTVNDVPVLSDTDFAGSNLSIVASASDLYVPEGVLSMWVKSASSLNSGKTVAAGTGTYLAAKAV